MIRARKRFGQHFLEPVWVDKVIAAIGPAADERFIEIGPGRGALTRPLAMQSADVIAVEIDRDWLARSTAARPSADQSQGSRGRLPRSAIARSPEALVADAARPLRIVGNLPYNVASPILFALVELFGAGVPLRDATVMLQREVADRLLAPRVEGLRRDERAHRPQRSGGTPVEPSGRGVPARAKGAVDRRPTLVPRARTRGA